MSLVPMTNIDYAGEAAGGKEAAAALNRIKKRRPVGRRLMS